MNHDEHPLGNAVQIGKFNFNFDDTDREKVLFHFHAYLLTETNTTNSEVARNFSVMTQIWTAVSKGDNSITELFILRNLNGNKILRVPDACRLNGHLWNSSHGARERNYWARRRISTSCLQTSVITGLSTSVCSCVQGPQCNGSFSFQRSLKSVR